MKLRTFVGLALLGIGLAVSAAETKKLELKYPILWLPVHEASLATVEEVEAAVEAVKPEIIKSNNYQKAILALIETGVDARDSKLTYADLCKKFDAHLAELNPNTDIEYYAEIVAGAKAMLGHDWWTPGWTKARRVDAVAALTGNERGFDRAIAQLIFNEKGLEASVPWFEKSADGTMELIGWYFNANQPEKAVELFWKTAFAGRLYPRADLFQKVVAYEYSREDFDAAKLKAKVTRLINLYKISARSFKGAEGVTNPWIEFIGVLQDTVNGL